MSTTNDDEQSDSPKVGQAIHEDLTPNISENEPPVYGVEAPLETAAKELELHTARQLLEGRWKIARGLLVLVAILAIAIFASAFVLSDSNYNNVKEIAPIVFSPLVTLLGTAVGWYYAAAAREK